MLDQAYNQGCEIALQELAESFGEDTVMELVKIAKDKERGNIGAAVGGLTGAGLAGWGGYEGGKRLSKSVRDSAGKRVDGQFTGKAHDWINQLTERRLKKLQASNALTEPAKNELMAKIKEGKGLLGHKNLTRAARALSRYPAMGAAGAVGGLGLGYAGKKLAE